MRKIVLKVLLWLWRLLKWLFVITVVLLVSISVAVNLQPVQQYAIEQGAAWFNEKTGGTLTVGKFDLRLPSFLSIDALSLEHPDGSKVAGFDRLELKLGWRKLLKKTILVDYIEISGLNVSIYSDTLSSWNYHFITEAFAANDSIEADSASTSANWEVDLRKLNLHKIKLRYHDAASRDSFQVSFADLRLRMDEFSLLQNRYLAKHIYLGDAKIHAQLGPRATTDSSASANDTATIAAEKQENSAMPELFFENLLLEKQQLYFTDLSDHSSYEMSFDTLELNPDSIDIEASSFGIESFRLSGLQGKIRMPASPPSGEAFTGDIFVPLRLDAKHISIQNSGIIYQTFNTLSYQSESNTFIQLGEVSLDLQNVKISPERYALQLKTSQLSYGGLPRIKSLSFAFELTPQEASLEQLKLQFGNSRIESDLALTYPNLASLVNTYTFSQAHINLQRSVIQPDDIAALLRFADPEADLPTLPQDAINLSLSLNGNYNALQIANLRAQTGSSSLQLSGNSAGDSLLNHVVSLSALNFFVKPADLRAWLPDSLDMAMLPASIQFAGKAVAGPKASSVNGKFGLPPYGDIDIEMQSGGWNSEEYNLKGSVNSQMIHLGNLAAADTFYTCFGLDVDLADLAGEQMYGTVFLDIPEFRMDAFHVHNLLLHDTLDGDFHQFGFESSDSSLVASIQGDALLGEILDITLKADISGIDFEYLGLTRKDFRLGTSFSAAYMQSDSLRQGKLSINSSVMVRDEERVDVSPMYADFYLGSDSTAMQFRSELITFQSTSNLSLDALLEHCKGLFKAQASDQIRTDGYWNFDLSTNNSSLISDMLLPDLKRLDPMTAKVRYLSSARSLDATLNMPYLEYGPITVDSTALELRSNNGSNTGSFGVRQVAYDTLTIDLIALGMQPDSAKGTTFTFALGGPPDEAPYRLSALLRHHKLDEATYWQLNPNPTFYLAAKEWKLDTAAYLRFTDHGTTVANLNFERNQQQLRFSKNDKEESLHFGAQRFKLGSLAEVFSQDELLFAGLLNAGMELNADGTFVGDGIIEDFQLAGADLGTFSFNGLYDNSLYSLSANLEGESMSMGANGTIKVSEDQSQTLDIQVLIERFAAQTLQEMLPSLVGSAKGSASGEINITGSSTAPKIEGNLQFDDIDMKIKGGGQYALKKETLRIEPGALVFPKFAILDSAGQQLTIDGKILHENFSNLRFDLNIKSERFTLLDVKKGEDPLFYGKLIVGSDIRITGTEALPVVRSDISLKRGSRMVYIVPESEYSSFENDGLVEWVDFDRQESPDILARDKSTERPAFTETLIDLSGNLIIDKETKFRIVIDPLAGDYLEIEGGGKLALGYDRAGRVNLAGTYTVSSGAYQMTFYDIVKRKFLIEPGSRITWNGDPFSADLDLTAIYPTRASALGLLNATTTGASSEGIRRMLDWEVLMLITGEMEQPEVAFDLRLDNSNQSSRGTTSGAIESRLAQLRENESELNMQVFSLMVFNSFLSEGGAGMSGSDMVSNQARNSASQLLTQQLNNLSNKLAGGVDLTFDLQSYGSEGASETDLSVDLSKTLFNDRVVVRVGSTVALEQNDAMADNSQQLMTNFIVEYKITTDGRYRLKAFRKTDIEDILVGRITRTGVGVLFRRSFDRGDQVFQKDADEKAAEAAQAAEEEAAKKQEKNPKAQEESDK